MISSVQVEHSYCELTGQLWRHIIVLSRISCLGF